MPSPLPRPAPRAARTSRGRLGLLGLLGPLGLLACARSEPAPAQQARGAHAERRSSAPSAFDLVPTPSGAALVWASGAPAALHVEPFDAAGRAQSAGARPIGVGEGVADVAAVAVGDARVLAWTESAASERRLWAAWVPASGPARAYAVGPAGDDVAGARGGLALAAAGHGARLLARGGPTECASTSERSCRGFHFFAIDADGARPLGMPLAVPSPCASQAAQLVPSVVGRPAGDVPEPFEYAVCSEAHATSALTVFSIRPNPAYAMAEEIFAGCTPLGAARFAGEPAFVARCGSERRLARLDRRDGAWHLERLEPRGVVCGAAGIHLRLGEGWLRPSEPLGGLELLLGEDLAPPGARAVWTGSALLVARSTEQGRLVLTRHACRGTVLVELDAGADAGG